MIMIHDNILTIILSNLRFVKYNHGEKPPTTLIYSDSHNLLYFSILFS